MTDDEPEMDTVWAFPASADLSFFESQPERVAEIAQRAFGDAKDAALAENGRLGIRSYGTVTDPPKPDRAYFKTYEQARFLCVRITGNPAAADHPAFRPGGG